MKFLPAILLSLLATTATARALTDAEHRQCRVFSNVGVAFYQERMEDKSKADIIDRIYTTVADAKTRHGFLIILDVAFSIPRNLSLNEVKDDFYKGCSDVYLGK